MFEDTSAFEDGCHSIIELSDDRKFCGLPNRSFAVYKKTGDAILPKIATTLLKKRDHYKALVKKHKTDKVLSKKYDQLQLLTKTQGNALFGGMSS